MATLGKALFNKLSGDSGVNALVSTRIYPELSPNQRTYPVCIYDIEYTDNQLSGNSSINYANVDIACVATTYDVAVSIAEAVRTALDKQSNVTWAGLRIVGCFLTSISEDVVTIQDAGENRYVIKTVSFQIIH